MGDLSKNFSRKEVACKCCGRIKDNALFREGIAKLQKLRELVGQPLIVNSGYRCSVHNEKVGGAKKSKHMEGHAFDITIPKGMTASEFGALARKVGFKGIGYYPKQRFVHMDLGAARTWNG